MAKEIHLRSPLTGRVTCPAYVVSPQAVTSDPGTADCKKCKDMLSPILDQFGNVWQIPGAHRKDGYTYEEMRSAYSAGLLRTYASLADQNVSAESMTPVPVDPKEFEDIKATIETMLETSARLIDVMKKQKDIIEKHDGLIKAIALLQRDHVERTEKYEKRIKALEMWARVATVEHVPGTPIPDFPLSATETAQNPVPIPEAPEGENVAQRRAHGADGAPAFWRAGVPRFYRVGDVVKVHPASSSFVGLSVIVELIGAHARVRSLDGASQTLVSLSMLRLVRMMPGSHGIFIER